MVMFLSGRHTVGPDLASSRGSVTLREMTYNETNFTVG